MVKKLKVRCTDRTVFEIDRETMEPKNTGSYDAYCFSDPEPDVEYMNHSEWCLKKQDLFFKRMKDEKF